VKHKNVMVGMKVRFHPIRGGKHDGDLYTVQRVGRLPCGQSVVWLKEMFCYVEASDLSEYVQMSCPRRAP
jgi:hypothetical protein